MEQNLKSEGKCLFCDQTFAKGAINRHLQTHLKQREAEGAKGKSFLVKIEEDSRGGASPYFLSLWVDGEATMKNIDKFLRDIWLECCGHLSKFSVPQNRQKRNGGWNFFEAADLLEKGKVKEYEKLMEETSGEVPMSRKVKQVLDAGLKLEYEYDFGSSTCLILNVVAEYSIKADNKIVLLSRNEPPEWLCDLCGKEPATQICTVHNWDEEAMFCNKCAPKHAKQCPDFEDYASMPVVNSPRMGVCGYEGGIIDKARDGVFVKK
ncbi:MAG: hypothetical protein LBC48_08420 [Dysgonamonadaceae bacterium]|jgi:hypothetical protein|nr:hypothetical protein [Dysgonamonadaceae bacterium]